MISRMKKHNRTFIALITAVVFIASPVFSAEQAGKAGDPGKKKPVKAAPLDESAFPGQLSPLLARGEYDRLLEHWIELIEKAPDDPKTAILLRRIGRLKSYCTNYAKTENLWRKLLDGGMKNGFNARTVRSAHGRWLKRRGREEDLEKLDLPAGYVQNWIVCGPFGLSDKSTHVMVFPPERELNLKASYPGSKLDGKAAWQHLNYKKPRRNINAFAFLRPTRGCVYALSQFRADKDRDVIVRVNRPSNYKLFLDGNLVLDVNRDENYEPYIKFVSWRLKAGWHRIMIKCSGNGSGIFSIELLEPTGHPAKGLTFDREVKEIRDLASSEALAGFFTDASCPFTDVLTYYRARVAREPENAAAHAALATLLDGQGLEVEALREIELAVKLAPENAVLWYEFARLYEQSVSYPDSLKTAKVRSAVAKVRELDPEFVPVTDMVVSDLESDDRLRDAIREIDKLLARKRDLFTAHKLAADIFNRKGWTAEVVDRWRQIERIYPDSEAITTFWQRYYRRHGNEAAADRFRDMALERNRALTGYKLDRIEQASERGDFETAMAYYRKKFQKEPDNYAYLSTIAGLHQKRGQYPEAISTMEELIRIYPEDQYYMRRIGRLYHEWGRKERAIEYYRKALEIDSSDSSLRRYICYLTTGEDDRFWIPYAHGDAAAKKIIENAPDADDFTGGASAALLLREVILRFYKDGSSSEYVHNVVKILDEKGVELYKEMPIRGEIEFMRSINPDGSVLEPDPIGGAQRMTGLTTGSILDYAYRTDNYFPQERAFTTGPWQLIDMARQTDTDTLVLPIQLMRTIMIIDKEIELQPPIQKNIGNYNITFSKRDSDDGSAHVFVWEGEDIPKYEPEPYMPSPKEWVPHVEIRGAKHRTWAEMKEQMMDGSFGNHRVSALIREAADGIMEKVTGDTARAKAFYRFVNEKIKTERGESNAHYILLTQTGSRIQLFLALLRAAKIPYDFVYVTPDPRLMAPIEWDWPQTSLFSGGTIFLIRPRGEKEHYVAFQRGADLYPYGKIPNWLQGGYIYSEKPGPDSKQLPRDPLFDRALQLTESTIFLNSMTVTRKIVQPQSNVYTLKHRVAEAENRMKQFYIQQMLNEVYPGATVTGFDFPGIDNASVPFAVTAGAKLSPNYVTARGKDRLFCPMGFTVIQLSRMVGLISQRRYDQALRNERIFSDTTIAYPPDGFEMARLPDTVQLNHGSYLYTLRFSLQADGAVRVERMLIMPPRLVPVEKYQSFVKFCSEVDEAEQTKLIFSRKQEKIPEPPPDEEKNK